MNKTINFGKINISEKTHPITIAEAAVEHLGSIKVAMRMAEEAKRIGVDVIKFQMHLPKEEMIPGMINFWGGSLDDILENYNLSLADHKTLIDYCKEIDIEYICTPFCPDAVDILNDLGVNAFKTGSGEMSNFPMMEKLSSTGKPIIISTGMSTEEEVNDLVQFHKEKNSNFMLMNCTSIYPAPYDAINLNIIPEFKKKYGLIVGHSDHTPDIWTSLGAVSLGAKVIEKHFTLNKNLKGPDYEVSLEPKQFEVMIDGIKKIHSALGNGKKEVHKNEIEVRSWANHSVVSKVNIDEGDTISREMITVKRPSGGIEAKYFEKVLNYKSKKRIEKNTMIQWNDLEKLETSKN
tara:strand:+ start:425 stop:1471 length:1047 start_codon:yes stop_codon:yes gene_type:complete